MDQLALSIDGFCKSHNITRAFLYQLWQRGAGPTRMKVGSRTLISVEAAEAWRRQMEVQQETPAPEAAA